jgi:hypothetical protein
MKLTRLEMDWAVASMGAIFPGSSSDGFADIQAMDLRGFLAQLMVVLPFQAALGVRAAVWLVALAPLFVLGRLRTIAGLPQADRERVVVALVANRAYVVRSLPLILKTMGALLYAAHDGVRARMLVPSRPATTLVPLRTKRVQAA